MSGGGTRGTRAGGRIFQRRKTQRAACSRPLSRLHAVARHPRTQLGCPTTTRRRGAKGGHQGGQRWDSTAVCGRPATACGPGRGCCGRHAHAKRLRRPAAGGSPTPLVQQANAFRGEQGGARGAAHRRRRAHRLPHHRPAALPAQLGRVGASHVCRRGEAGKRTGTRAGAEERPCVSGDPQLG